MVKKEEGNNLMLVLVIGLVFFLATRETVISTPTTPDYTGLIDAGVSVTGRNLYEPGTALSTEDVRVIRLDGGTKRVDLGSFSLDGTDIGVTSNVDYKFYFFMNTSPSTSYYVDVLDYTGLEQDAVDDIYGEGCTIDTQPTFWVVNSGGATQTATTNAQAVSASGSAEIMLNIKAHSEQCYGIPDAKDKGEKNAICFLYSSSSVFSKIDTNTGNAPTPNSISESGNATLRSIIDCYKFPVIANTDSVEIPVTITAGATEPTIAHNITVMSEDSCVTVSKDTLNEIWGYQDEDNDDICGQTVKLGEIYIS